MHALFFEMRPKPGHLAHYFEHVERLRPVLARHEGLVFLERYGAVHDPDLVLSHQLWRSEADIIAWRRDPEHRRSQAAGRKVHFADYRIRVGARILHRGPDAAAGPAPEAAEGAPCLLALYGTRPASDPAFAAYASLTRPGRFVSLADLASPAARDALLAAEAGRPGIDAVAAYAIDRDYGLTDRAAAPA